MSHHLSGASDVFANLIKDHRRIRAAIARAKVSEDTRFELWPQIRSELLEHDRYEIRVISPVLRANPRLAAIADRHDAEAMSIDTIIEHLDRLPTRSHEFTVLFGKLAGSVILHADHEEQFLFPQIQEGLGRENAHRLDSPAKPDRRSSMGRRA